MRGSPLGSLELVSHGGHFWPMGPMMRWQHGSKVDDYDDDREDSSRGTHATIVSRRPC